TIDHVVPRSRGGTHSWDNCVAACRTCNSKKADRLIEELGWTLQVTPRAPRAANGLLVLAVEPLPAWEPWLGQRAAWPRESRAECGRVARWVSASRALSVGESRAARGPGSAARPTP